MYTRTHFCCSLQASALLYLLLARPFYDWQLMTVELIAHSSHVAMTVLALALANTTSTWANWFMVALLVLVLCVIIIFEVRDFKFKSLEGYSQNSSVEGSGSGGQTLKRTLQSGGNQLRHKNPDSTSPSRFH